MLHNRKLTRLFQLLANAVDNEENLDFLSAICPKKITVREYKEILAKQKDDSDSSDDETEEEESESGSSEEGESSGGEEEVVEISDDSAEDPKTTKTKPKSGK
jgi:hypothetical protein